MATQAIAGRKAFVASAATSSGTLVEIGEITNYSIKGAHKQIDATSNDSSGWDEFIDGQKGWSLQCSALYARTDAQQKAIRQSLISGGSRYFQVRPSTSQTQLYKGTGYITDFEVAGETKDALKASFGIIGTRALTFTT